MLKTNLVIFKCYIAFLSIYYEFQTILNISQVTFGSQEYYKSTCRYLPKLKQDKMILKYSRKSFQEASNIQMLLWTFLGKF